MQAKASNPRGEWPEPMMTPSGGVSCGCALVPDKQWLVCVHAGPVYTVGKSNEIAEMPASSASQQLPLPPTRTRTRLVPLRTRCSATSSSRQETMSLVALVTMSQAAFSSCGREPPDATSGLWHLEATDHRSPVIGHASSLMLGQRRCLRTCTCPVQPWDSERDSPLRCSVRSESGNVLCAERSGLPRGKVGILVPHAAHAHMRALTKSKRTKHRATCPPHDVPGPRQEQLAAASKKRVLLFRSSFFIF